MSTTEDTEAKRGATHPPGGELARAKTQKQVAMGRLQTNGHPGGEGAGYTLTGGWVGTFRQRNLTWEDPEVGMWGHQLEGVRDGDNQ